MGVIIKIVKLNHNKLKNSKLCHTLKEKSQKQDEIKEEHITKPLYQQFQHVQIAVLPYNHIMYAVNVAIIKVNLP